MAKKYYEQVRSVQDPQRRWIGYYERLVKDYHTQHFHPTSYSSTNLNADSSRKESVDFLKRLGNTKLRKSPRSILLQSWREQRKEDCYDELFDNYDIDEPDGVITNGIVDTDAANFIYINQLQSYKATPLTTPDDGVRKI